MRRWALEASCAAAIAACGGQQAHSGVTEPITVSGAQFVGGPLPGMPPPDAGHDAGDGSAAEGGKDAGTTKLPPESVSTVTFSDPFILSGFAGTSVSGLATTDSVAVGVRLKDQGTGYWVVPVQAQDVQFPGLSDFSFSVSFNPADTTGNTALRVVGIGSNGQGGQQLDAPICIESRIPDDGHACFPTSRTVPALVFTLTWDTDFDVDLNVITPAGLNVNPKTSPLSVVGSTTAPVAASGAVGFYDGTIGVFDRDSIGNCVVDGWHEEDLVFQEAPAAGTYLVYANPFASCGVESVRFTLTIYTPGPDKTLAPAFSSSGQLLALQQSGSEAIDGGSSAGLFVYQFSYAP